MKLSDLVIIAVAVIILATFASAPGAVDAFRLVSKEHCYAMSFVKFALLATFGECLALRITTGAYNRPGFGVLPKMLVWGILGVIIKMAFVIFAVGAPTMLAALGAPVSAQSLAHGAFGLRLLTAFAVSLSVNVIFTPWMMTAHKITDTHIRETGGTLAGALSPVDMGGILDSMDWNVMWNFVFKKTIPLFWIPAHTVTFMLPGELQMLFAALLGIVLGLILAFAAGRAVPAARPASA